jgi:hypothetical protein
MKSKINLNFLTFWDFFRAIGPNNREKLSFFRTRGAEEDPKILKSRRTKVVINDMKFLEGPYSVFAKTHFSAHLHVYSSYANKENI